MIDKDKVRELDEMIQSIKIKIKHHKLMISLHKARLSWSEDDLNDDVKMLAKLKKEKQKLKKKEGR